MLNAVGAVFLLLVFKVSHSPADAGARARGCALAITIICKVAQFSAAACSHVCFALSNVFLLMFSRPAGVVRISL